MQGAEKFKNIYSKCKDDVLPVVFLLIITLLLFAKALGDDFLLDWDDSLYVTANEAVRGVTFDHLRQAFSTFYVGNYAPIQIVSYMIDYTVGGLNPVVFILSNILLHAANGILYYLILARLLQDRTISCLAALFFLLHPLQVESVAWISQRKNVLAMFFMLVAFYAYLQYRRTGRDGRKTPYAVSLITFALSLLSKSVTVIFPLVLFLYDLCFLPKKERRSWIVDKIPFALCAIAVVFLSTVSQSKTLAAGGMGGPDAQGGGLTGYHGGTPYATFLTMLTVLARYLALLLWPADLSAVYLPTIRTAVDGAVAGAALLAAVMAGIGIYLFIRKRPLFFWYALFFVGLLPVSQIIPLVTLMNDRYMYFPMLGAAAFLCTVTAQSVTGNSRKALVGGWCAVMVLLSFATFNRISVWENSYTFWSDAVQKVPSDPSVHYILGTQRLGSGKVTEAIAELQTALRLDPRLLEAHYNLGLAYLEARREDLAIQEFERAIAINPNFAEIHFQLGRQYFLKGRTAPAIAEMNKALSLNPQYAEARNQLGIAYATAGVRSEAVRQFSEAVRLKPDEASFRENLARASRM